MPLTKASGNMYSWVSHTWTPLAGRCPHECSYCYVQAMGKRFPGMAKRYGGPLRMEEDFPVLGAGRTIFVGHLNDLFADEVKPLWLARVLEHCRKFAGNTYVFQTKNTKRLRDWAEAVLLSILKLIDMKRFETI